MQIQQKERLPDGPFPVPGGQIICTPWIMDDKLVHSLHWHNYCELGYCIAGEGILIVEESFLSFQSGDVFFIPPHEAHRGRSSNPEGSQWLFFHFSLSGLPEAGFAQLAMHRPPGEQRLFSIADRPELTRNIQTLADCCILDDNSVSRRCQYLLLALLESLARLPGFLPVSTPGSRHLQQLAPAVHKMQQHYSEKIKIPELARLCGMSESLFRLRFQEVYQMSPLQYFIDFRMKIALHLLRNCNYTIDQTAAAVGYQDCSTFYRHFLRKYGLAPSEKKRFQD